MRPHLPRSKVALGRYCVNCCAITSLPASLGSHQLATCPSQSFPQSRLSKRAFQSSAIRVYTDNSPVKLPPKLKSKSPVSCNEQLSQWEAKYFQLIPLSKMQRRSSFLETIERMGGGYREFDKSLSKTSQLLELTETSLKGRNRFNQENRKVGHCTPEQRQHDLRQYTSQRYACMRASADNRKML